MIVRPLRLVVVVAVTAAAAGRALGRDRLLFVAFKLLAKGRQVGIVLSMQGLIKAVNMHRLDVNATFLQGLQQDATIEDGIGNGGPASATAADGVTSFAGRLDGARSRGRRRIGRRNCVGCHSKEQSNLVLLPHMAVVVVVDVLSTTLLVESRLLFLDLIVWLEGEKSEPRHVCRLPYDSQTGYVARHLTEFQRHEMPVGLRVLFSLSKDITRRFIFRLRSFLETATIYTTKEATHRHYDFVCLF